ncbi:MAG: 1-acyl-sn-glycerol-3-phosphate acyltransferase [Mollicutes bacterium]|nr:1-acyl-sn-glycerol-3-phosphate acyltransferase [Mollicutes bacterium]
MKKKNNIKKDRNLFYSLSKFILKIPFILYYRPTIIGKEKIPKEGPIIFVGNHIHLFDQCLPILATNRIIHYMAKKEYFTNWKVSWFFKLAGCISVDRKTNDQKAAHSALNVLKKGYALGIFPEGTRNRTNEILLPFKKGAVSMAQKTGATIVPFIVTGKYERKGNLTCTFLNPITVKKDEDITKANNNLRQLMIDNLKKHA